MNKTGIESAIHRFAREGEAFRWPGVDVKHYNASGTQSQGMTKQIVFPADAHLPAEVRYFEAEPGGYSALERHQHVHAVLILRGHGSVMIDGEVHEINAFDTVYVPPGVWHQFYAAPDSWLGFLCLVNCERDLPSRPTEADIAELRRNPAIRDVIRW